MNHRFLSAAVIVVSALTGPAAQAAGPADGKSLHDGNCIACHRSMFGGKPERIYTRPDRRVNSLKSLRTQVQRCAVNLGLQWYPEEVDAVTTYLNGKYYKLK